MNSMGSKILILLQIKNLEAPYGDCIVGVESMSKCIERKRLRATLIECGCISENATDAEGEISTIYPFPLSMPR